MFPTTVPRHGPGSRLLGYILAIPVGFLLLILVGGVFTRWGGVTEPGAAGAAGCVTAAFCGLLIVPLAISLILLGKRKVWKCGTCGYVFDRG
jgi:hypothetical protein